MTEEQGKQTTESLAAIEAHLRGVKTLLLALIATTAASCVVTIFRLF